MVYCDSLFIFLRLSSRQALQLDSLAECLSLKFGVTVRYSFSGLNCG